ncbi:MAG: TonB family protein [Pyrinomonadaceae bacterium]|nr:TonB family protein [Pyrinomonadaceae bacterium]
MKSSLLSLLLIALSGTSIHAPARQSFVYGTLLPSPLQGTDVNRRDETGLTPLMQAVQNDEDREMKSLIEHGANVNEADRYGWTALNYSVATQDASKVKLLLNSGAEVNTKDRRGMTPLMWAAIGGKTEIVKLLLGKGAELNAQANNGATALSFATAKGHDRVAELLKKAGATGPQLGKENVPDGLVPVDKAPKILNPRDGIPGYTEEARRNRVQGTVRLYILFGTDGSVKKVKIIKGLSHGLTEEAARATFRLKASPAMNDGQAIEYWIAGKLDFTIR